MISRARLFELLIYCPHTGIFTWKIRKGPANIGDVAGCKHPSGYWVIRIDGKSHRSHRLAWLYIHGVAPNEIDHINRIKSDNRIINLRSVDRKTNCRNMPKRENISGITGVYWNKKDKLWVASIRVDKKNIYGGCFKRKSDAITARKSLEKYHKFHINHGIAV